MSDTPSNLTSVLIHVFLGAVSGRNNSAFTAALDWVTNLPEFRMYNFDIKIKSNEDIRKKGKEGWSEARLADWLAAANIYFVVNHPTLGNTNHQTPHWEKDPVNCWKPWDLEKIVDVFHERLQSKIGWPEDLRCNVVWQTKIGYKNATHAVGTPYLIIRKTADGKLSKEVKREIFE